MVNFCWPRISATYSIFAAFVLSYPLYSDIAIAQITPDSSLGTERTVVSPDMIINGRDSISGGALRGSNLFHSFQDFNVQEGREVYFVNPNGITNIFGRITGGNPSDIRGRLGVFGNANLFLLNPRGIILGPTSSLDLRGSFIGTTGESIEFSDGSSFGVSERQAGINLTISIPLGIRFEENSGSISSQEANLAVDLNRTLALVGGSLNLEGGVLEAPAGRIELGSISGNGLVGVDTANSLLTLSFDGIDTSAFGNINLSEGSLVRAREPNGSIAIQAAKLSLREGSQISVTTFGAGDSGDLVVRASDSINIQGRNDNGISGLFARVDSMGNGQGGNISIETQDLEIRDGGTITTSSSGLGNAGNIKIEAGNIEIDGEVRRSSFVIANPGGNTITVVTIINSFPSTILSRIEGSGDINDPAAGNSGNIIIHADSVSVRNSAYISASSLGNGNAGNVTLNAEDAVTLDFGAIYSQATQNGFGAGTIYLSTNSSLFLNNSQIFAESSSSSGGDIVLNVADAFFLREGSVITATAGRDDPNGKGGTIEVNTSFLIANPGENSDIIARGSQQGGTIRIQALEIFGLRPTEELTANSDISVSTLNEQLRGTDGTLIIEDAPELEPTRELAVLPDSLVSVPSLVNRGCNPLYGSQSSGNFIVRNRSRTSIEDLGEPEQIPMGNTVPSDVQDPPTSPVFNNIYEADQVTFLEDGSIRFVASQSNQSLNEELSCD